MVTLCSCGNLVACTCKLERRHGPDCPFARAAKLAVELPCPHGFQACPECDPCSCGAEVAPEEGIR